jgi:hypothetical protein
MTFTLDHYPIVILSHNGVTSAQPLITSLLQMAFYGLSADHPDAQETMLIFIRDVLDTFSPRTSAPARQNQSLALRIASQYAGVINNVFLDNGLALVALLLKGVSGADKIVGPNFLGSVNPIVAELLLHLGDVVGPACIQEWLYTALNQIVEVKIIDSQGANNGRMLNDGQKETILKAYDA